MNLRGTPLSKIRGSNPPPGKASYIISLENPRPSPADSLWADYSTVKTKKMQTEVTQLYRKQSHCI